MATLNETLVCNDEMDEAFDTYEESLNLSEYSSGQSTFDSGNFYRLSAISCRPKSAYFHWGYICVSASRKSDIFLSLPYHLFLQIANPTTICPVRHYVLTSHPIWTQLSRRVSPLAKMYVYSTSDINHTLNHSLIRYGRQTHRSIRFWKSARTTSTSNLTIITTIWMCRHGRPRSRSQPRLTYPMGNSRSHWRQLDRVSRVYAAGVCQHRIWNWWITVSNAKIAQVFIPDHHQAHSFLGGYKILKIWFMYQLEAQAEHKFDFSQGKTKMACVIRKH